MKRIIISLLLLQLFTVFCSAQDYSEEGTYSIAMMCEKAPSYSIRIPKTVNVINENTIMNYYVKGDIYADQTLMVVFDSDTVLTYKNRIIPVAVSQNKYSWTCGELTDSYVSSSVSISHTKLSAGTWLGNMNVAISLQGGR